MSESRDILKEEFQDKEYRHAYAEDFLNTKIAAQIRVLREQRGWTQADLADRIGTKQAGVSRLENVNYSGWKIETLKKIARAFDVTFNGGFESFGKLLDEAEKFSRETLEKPSFENDPGFYAREAASAKVQRLAIGNLYIDQLVIRGGSDMNIHLPISLRIDRPKEAMYLKSIKADDTKKEGRFIYEGRAA